MARKPVSVQVVAEGDERYVELTYANGDVVRRRVEADIEPRRRPRRPSVRITLSDRPAAKPYEG